MQVLSSHLTQLLVEIQTFTTVDYTSVPEEFHADVMRKPLSVKAQKEVLMQLMSQRLPRDFIRLILPDQGTLTVHLQAKIIVGLACMRRHTVDGVYSLEWSVTPNTVSRLRKLLRAYIRNLSRCSS
jgi:hypothetical protein